MTTTPKTLFTLLFTVLFMGLLSACATPTAPPPAVDGAIQGVPGASAPNPKYQKLNSQILAIQKEYGLPALQAVIFDRSETTYKFSQGVRAIEHDTPIKDDDVFMIPSAGKVMTALLIGQLIDLKLLDWNTPIKDILGREIGMKAVLGNITIEMLLAQTSGLIDVQSLKVWPSLQDPKISAKRGRELLAKSILSYDPQFPPGSKTRASDSSYVVLAWILEKLTNFTFEELVKNKLILPLGMQSCGLGPAGSAKAEKPDQPWGHRAEAGRLASVRPEPSADFPRAFASAGGLHCSVQDWIKLLREVNLGALQESFLIKEATFQKLLGPAHEVPYTHSGLARYERIWSGGTTLMVSGSNTYSFAISALAPSREMALIVVTNSGTAKAQEGATKVLKLLTEAVQ